MKKTIALLLAAVMLLSLLAACSKTEAPAEEPAQEEQTTEAPAQEETPAEAPEQPGAAQPAQAEPPEGLRCELRGYQRTGLSWLCALAEAGFGGILAADMGLGKTVQALSLIHI